jgi:hypothetical protein
VPRATGDGDRERGPAGQRRRRVKRRKAAETGGPNSVAPWADGPRAWRRSVAGKRGGGQRNMDLQLGLRDLRAFAVTFETARVGCARAGLPAVRRRPVGWPGSGNPASTHPAETGGTRVEGKNWSGAPTHPFHPPACSPRSSSLRLCVSARDSPGLVARGQARPAGIVAISCGDCPRYGGGRRSWQRAASCLSSRR